MGWGPGTYPYKSLVLGNVSYNNGGRGIQAGPTSGNVVVYNNTSYKNNLDTIWAETCRVEVIVLGINTNVVNNVLYAVPMKTGQVLTQLRDLLGWNYRQK